MEESMDRETVFQWARQQYGSEPDYPWKDQNAVLRHKHSGKWYAAVLTVSRNKLGLPEDGIVDVLNVKSDPLLIGSLRMQPGFHPAYHMNKDKWISIRLDGSVPEEKVEKLTALSYELTRMNKKKE